ncbi:hypothetical protein JTE90_004019 [Oedothorax gibbosus]|uniref:Uncharacterized protein n=1 Tax=Oedothorax gibbosus TaxID=931172 RepID=A0AAV6U4I1_9ARAC|nr:hypothetical protein JTE90_004019 [Oedothorax gibbosus]
MPNYCVPLRDLKALFNNDLTPHGKLITEKLSSLEYFFDDHDKCQLSMGMRNVLVGEFIAPILDQFKPPGRSGSTGKVDNMVEVRKKEIEIEKERNNSCNKFLEKLVKGRADEISSTKKILAHNDVNFREQNEKIVSISNEMGEIKEAVKNSLDNRKIDLTNHSMPSSSASPTYADIIGRENNNTTTMFVDLPTDGEGGKDFKGFKSKLESLLTNENVKCNGIFETKKRSEDFRPFAH